jgi:hypothetical protein
MNQSRLWRDSSRLRKNLSRLQMTWFRFRTNRSSLRMDMFRLRLDRSRMQMGRCKLRSSVYDCDWIGLACQWIGTACECFNKGCWINTWSHYWSLSPLPTTKKDMIAFSMMDFGEQVSNLCLSLCKYDITHFQLWNSWVTKVWAAPGELRRSEPLLWEFSKLGLWRCRLPLIRYWFPFVLAFERVIKCSRTYGGRTGVPFNNWRWALIRLEGCISHTLGRGRAYLATPAPKLPYPAWCPISSHLWISVVTQDPMWSIWVYMDLEPSRILWTWDMDSS